MLAQEHKICIVNPNQIFIVGVHRHYWVNICQIKDIVSFPKSSFVKVLLDVQTLEIMEKRLQNMLMKNQKVLNLLFLVENWRAVVWYE